MTLLCLLEIAMLIALSGIIIGTVLGRLPGRCLATGMPLALAALILAPLSGASAVAETAKAALSFPDRNRQAVVDAANVIPDTQERKLADRIGAYVKRTGHQLVVATVPSLQGLEIRDYGYRLGRAWGLGRKGVDDGAILLSAPTERKVDIEVGYGLEPTLTDALTSRIIHERITPKLKAGDVAGALSDGADAIMGAASGKPDDTIRSAQTNQPKPETYSALEILCYLLILGTPGALLVWLLGRSERREQSAAERRYAEIKASSPARPYSGDRGGLLKTARARKDDDIAAGLGAAAVAESFTRRSESDTPSYSAPSSPSVDTGSFDSGGGSFGGGGASSDY